MDLELAIADLAWPFSAIDLAPRAEALGYARFWLGEHHSPYQSGAPLLLAAVVAGLTERIRVGTAGVCLPYYSPYSVAEQAWTLSALYPGRIDLGVCNGTGAPAAVKASLLDGRDGGVDVFVEKAIELHRMLTGRFPEGHALAGHRVGPPIAVAPDYWVLGMSPRAARLAAQLGAGFFFSEHHVHLYRASVDGAALVEEYRARFEPSPELPAPRVAVLVSGICTETESEWRAWDARRERTDGMRPMIGGTAEHWMEAIHATAARLGTKAIAVMDLFDPMREVGERRRMLELIARAAGLEADGDEPQGGEEDDA